MAKRGLLRYKRIGQVGQLIQEKHFNHDFVCGAGGGGLGPDFNNYVVGREGHTSIIILYVGWGRGQLSRIILYVGRWCGGGPIFNHYFALFQ